MSWSFISVREELCVPYEYMKTWRSYKTNLWSLLYYCIDLQPCSYISNITVVILILETAVSLLKSDTTCRTLLRSELFKKILLLTTADWTWGQWLVFIQYKPTKCTFSKLIFQFFYVFYTFWTRGFIFRKMDVYVVMVRYVLRAEITVKGWYNFCKYNIFYLF